MRPWREKCRSSRVGRNDAPRELVELRSAAARAFLAAALTPFEKVSGVRAPIEREAGQPDVVLSHAFQKIFGKRLQVVAKGFQRIAAHTPPEEVWRERVTGGTLPLVMRRRFNSRKLRGRCPQSERLRLRVASGIYRKSFAA